MWFVSRLQASQAMRSPVVHIQNMARPWYFASATYESTYSQCLYTHLCSFIPRFLPKTHTTPYMLPGGIKNIAKGTTAINMLQILLTWVNVVCMKYEFLIFDVLHHVIRLTIETCFFNKMQKNWGLWQNKFSTCCRHVLNWNDYVCLQAHLTRIPLELIFFWKKGKYSF